ncbi:cholecystokinin receptor [Elysia marginata]|uniref:Cholecystokinin receptor n=1 Tax=Elysia marginata TaxID=1093978 RepID=A0AAV4HZK3_9GAST|nr:cholecystokinin receptor [Elysia marginata]
MIEAPIAVLLVSVNKFNMADADIFIPVGHHYTTNVGYNISISSSNSSNNNSTVEPWAGISADDYLAELDSRFAEILFPATFFLGVLMVAGAVGNAAVLYVYTCRARGQGGTVTRFIQALAVFDLLSCCLAIPGEILDMRNNYTFGRSPLCKMVRTINLFCTLTSGITLIVVAIDRYKRICCPLKKQISPRGAAIIVFLASVMAAVLSSPTAVIYGSRSVGTGHPTVKGSDCSIGDRYVNTPIPLIYNGVQMLLFTIGFFILLVLYVFIARRIWQHEHQRLQRRRSTMLFMPDLRKGHRFPTSPSDVASSSPPTTELASPITLTPEELKGAQSGGDARKNIFFKNIEASAAKQEPCLRDSLETKDIPDGTNDRNLKKSSSGRTGHVAFGATFHRRCSSDPHNQGLNLGKKRAQWKCPAPGELVGSLPEMETWDGDSGIGAESTPPGSALPDTLNCFDRLPKPDTERAALSGHTTQHQRNSSGQDVMVSFSAQNTDNMQVRTFADTSCLSSEPRLENVKRNSLPSAVMEALDKSAGATDPSTSAADINVIALQALSTPVLPKVERGKDCHVSLSFIDQTATQVQCGYESSAPDIPLLKPFVGPGDEENSKNKNLKTISSRQRQGYHPPGFENSKEMKAPRVGGSCGDLAPRKSREPRCHRRLGSSAVSIARSEGDHMTICSDTLSEDDGETEEELLADTTRDRDATSAFTASPDSETGIPRNRKCSHKNSITSRQSLRARLASSTTNILAKFVSNEKSVSEWDATLDFSDAEMITIPRGYGKSHSSKRKPRLSDASRRASGGHCIGSSEQDTGKNPRKVSGTVWYVETDEGGQPLERHSVSEQDGVAVKEAPVSQEEKNKEEEEEEEEQLEKKVLFRNLSLRTKDSPGQRDTQEDVGSQAQSEEATEDRAKRVDIWNEITNNSNNNNINNNSNSNSNNIIINNNNINNNNNSNNNNKITMH